MASQIELIDRKLEEKYLGLTDEQIEERKRTNLINNEIKPPSKSVFEIIRTNIFTYFNLIFLLISLILIAVKSYRDLTFLPIIISNAVIGIVQELRSKKILDKLNMLNAPYAIVIRNGKEQKVATKELVKDDIVIFNAGDQICADAEIIEGKVSVNESLLTGEQDEIEKNFQDKLLSGSYIVSGKCYAKLTNVGADSYISKLTIQAKKTKNGEQSEMIRSLNKIVKFAGIIIIPIGMALLFEQYKIEGTLLKESVQAMVAAIIGMIPEGLFLLASVTLAISAMKLAQDRVLIHDMKSIETLARVDVLCVDKTGTITDGKMKVRDCIVLDGFSKSKKELELLIGDFTDNQSNDNITMEAIKMHFSKNRKRKASVVVGFSSEFKYSGVGFENENYVLGAPEFVLKEKYEKYKEQVETFNKKGERVLVFCQYNDSLNGRELGTNVIPLGLIIIGNSIRENAIETFKYFREQGVEIKVISGDNPITVSEIAKKAMIQNAEKCVDASLLKNKQQISEAVQKYTVFGRVTPEQKRMIIRELKKLGKTVAMTGDGVNDILALKDSDCSIAMASGSQAAVQASQLVLLDSDFSKMPGVVKEGRRVVNNLECSGSLFLVKNIFSICLALIAICINVKYPLKPSQISLISMFTIGLPAFLLSQAPNTKLIKGSFIKNILSRALPGGLTDILIVILIVILGTIFNLTEAEISTAATFLLVIVGLMIVHEVSKPITLYKMFILAMSTIGLIVCSLALKDLFSITELSMKAIEICIVLAIFIILFLRVMNQVADRIMSFVEKKL